jgi:holliday junction DNA helicase RuvA
MFCNPPLILVGIPPLPNPPPQGGRELARRARNGRAMIGRLKGVVDAVGEAHVIIDVNGVGYEVSASARTLRTLSLGQVVSLAIETHVREDAIRLFGFTSEVERAWFRTLQTIQGVGAKVALAVLGTLSPQDLGNAIALSNWAAVEQSPGVGKKLAQRIVSELKDKAPALSVAGLNVPVSGRKGGPAAVDNSAAAEAISALTNLGYQPAQASQAVAAAIAELGDAADTPKLIRRGLKELAR